MHHILVPIDGSPLSQRALEHALTHYPDAAITTIYVINPVDSLYTSEIEGWLDAEMWYESAQERADTIHETAQELAAESDIELQAVTEIGRPAREILTYATEHDIDQIIMGSHGRKGFERMMLGSVAESVIRRARIPVTIIR